MLKLVFKADLFDCLYAVVQEKYENVGIGTVEKLFEQLKGKQVVAN